MNPARRKAAVLLGSTILLSAALGSCAKQSPPQKPMIHTTRSFDALFGELPPIAVPGPCFATVVYFPSAREAGKYLPVPMFSAEQGKEEALTLRTAIRGVEADGLSGEVDRLFPAGADLDSVTYEGNVARVKVGGTFRAGNMPRELGLRAARAVALTAAQFGKAIEVDLTDEGGKVHFSGRSDEARTVSLGPPKALGLLAIREKPGEPPAVLSVLFDRPVFVDDVAFFPPGGEKPFAGKAYSAGFGLTVEMHPDGNVTFDPKSAYRVRIAVRDGKGRKTREEGTWIPKDVTRD